MSSTGRPLTPIPLEAPAAPAAGPVKPEAITLSAAFNVQGILALPESNQFAIFGQLKEQNKALGYVEYCDTNAKVVRQVNTGGNIVWHATALPNNKSGAQIAVLEDNHGDSPEAPKDAIRHRVIYAQTDTASAAASTSPKGTTWTPAFVTAPDAAMPPESVAGKKAPRIKLEDREVEQYREFPRTNDFLPVPTSSQYFVYTPNGRYVLAGCATTATVALLARDEKGAFTTPRKLPKIESKDFLAAAWLSDSTHYVISTVRHGLILGSVRYPGLAVKLPMDSPVHAVTTIPNSATLITSHRDGSVRVYDAEDQLAHLRTHSTRSKETRLATAGKGAACPNVNLLSTLKVGLFRREKAVLIDIASLSNLHETTLMMHERGTHTIERITLKHDKTWREIQNAWRNLKNELTVTFANNPEAIINLLGIISEYARSYASPIPTDINQASVVPADRPVPRLV